MRRIEANSGDTFTLESGGVGELLEDDAAGVETGACGGERDSARFAFLAQPEGSDAGELPSGILVAEFWNLGDLAIVVPFLKNLRRSYPEARISLLVNAGLATFLEGQGLVDEFIRVRVPWVQHHSRWKKYNPFSRDWISFVRTLQAVRKRQFDWAISGRMDLRDNFLLWLSGAARRIGYGLGGGGFLLTDCVSRTCRGHIARTSGSRSWMR